MKYCYRWHHAVNGYYVSKEYAKKYPAITVRVREKLGGFCNPKAKPKRKK